ncbi:hypothetical protein [Thiohalocapsa sp. ML1]|jgi:hypothetical protein|uniref:hypothetical protein n=1 Tax=Thiohalocapsa sp. ML1 TaxID=1431688 RepID=UPI0012E36418|nr:hypothetical protein [Thiohalocapsa sp. ML1]
MSLVSPVLRGALCAAALVLAAGPAGAALVPLDNSNPDFNDNLLNNGDTATGGSIVLTFGNVLSAYGGNAVGVDGDGIYLAGATSSYGTAATSFSIVFDTDTLIDQYTVGYIQLGPTGGFQLAGANGTSGLNDMSTVGTFTFDMGSIPFFAAGQMYTLTHTISGGGFVLSELDSFNISEYSDPNPAPAPATALLLAGGLLGLRTLRRAPRRD